MRRVSILSLCGAVAAFWACELPFGAVCAGVGYNALQIDIRDARGEPQALGARVELSDGSYHELDSTSWSALTVMAADERGGRTYDILVSKPFYNDVIIRNVKTRGGGCVTGHESPPVTSILPVTLTLAPGAPAIRSVHLLPPQAFLDRAPHPTTVTPQIYIDANPGVSRSVIWRIDGDTASASLDTATGRLDYRCLAKNGRLKLIATSVVDSSLSGEVDVAVQGHPINTSDPPCSG